MWNGVFSPLNKKRSVGAVVFVPLAEMTPEAWRILEYENLRDRAKNRIADQIVAGDLEGFFHVKIIEKGKTKPNYFWPASKKQVDGFRQSPGSFVFANEPDDDDLNSNAATVEEIIFSLSMLSLSSLGAIIAILIGAARDDDKSLLERIKNESEEYSRQDALLIIAIIGIKYFGIDGFDNILGRA